MDNRIEEVLRRSPKGTREALLAFNSSGDLQQLERFTRGIIARNIDDAYLETLEQSNDSTRLIDDLGIDSLTMVEIAMTLEDALDIELVDDELKGLETWGDIRAELVKKINAAQRNPKEASEV